MSRSCCTGGGGGVIILSFMSTSTVAVMVIRMSGPGEILPAGRVRFACQLGTIYRLL